MQESSSDILPCDKAKQAGQVQCFSCFRKGSLGRGFFSRLMEMVNRPRNEYVFQVLSVRNRFLFINKMLQSKVFIHSSVQSLFHGRPCFGNSDRPLVGTSCLFKIVT